MREEKIKQRMNSEINDCREKEAVSGGGGVYEHV
jgi:hypothetical protein